MFIKSPQKPTRKWGLFWGLFPETKCESPMPLTVAEVKNAKQREKLYKMADEKGLYLLVNPNGSKLWKFKYRFSGVEKKLSFGAFPDVSVSAARDALDEARRQLTNTIDLEY